MTQKILMSVNTAWNVANFRVGLIRALIDHGYEIVVAAPGDEYVGNIRNLGCRFVSLPMDNNGTNPVRDLSLLARYLKVLRAEKPQVYLGYTVKPNVYGSLAAHLLGIPVINNIAGLGTTFINRSLLTHLVRTLYRISLHRSRRVFFQNADDERFFIQEHLVRPMIADRLPGSGVDLSHYRPVQLPPMQGRPFRFLLVARILKDKGVEEYVDAARIVRRRMPGVEFQVLGFIDQHNANSIPLARIHEWEREGLIRYLGKTDDVRGVVGDADCIVLPSYREGVPHSLLEAAAMARPVITTDTAGCRDAVDDHVSGLLCRVRDAADLAERMIEMVDATPECRHRMGQAGRRKVEEHFDERIVIRKYLEMIEQIARPSRRPEWPHRPECASDQTAMQRTAADASKESGAKAPDSFHMH